MKLNRLKNGWYRGEIEAGIFLWVIKERNGWYWHLYAYEPEYGEFETEPTGPFQTKKEAVANAKENYNTLLG